MCSLIASSPAIYPSIPYSTRSNIWGTKNRNVTNCSFPLEPKFQRLYTAPLVAKRSPKYFPTNHFALSICGALETETETFKHRPISPISFPSKKSLSLFENHETDDGGGFLPPGGGGGGLFRYFRGDGGGGWGGSGAVGWLGIFILLVHLVVQCITKDEGLKSLA